MILKIKAENEAENAQKAKKIADENAQKAKQQSVLAKQSEVHALEQKLKAEKHEKIALSNEAKAIELKGVAEAEKKAAELAKKEAENQREIANQNAAKAIKEEFRANRLKNIEQAKRWIVLADKYSNLEPNFSAKLLLNAHDTLVNNGFNIQKSSLFSAK